MAGYFGSETVGVATNTGHPTRRTPLLKLRNAADLAASGAETLRKHMATALPRWPPARPKGSAKAETVLGAGARKLARLAGPTQAWHFDSGLWHC